MRGSLVSCRLVSLLHGQVLGSNRLLRRAHRRHLFLLCLCQLLLAHLKLVRHHPLACGILLAGRLLHGQRGMGNRAEFPLHPRRGALGCRGHGLDLARQPLRHLDHLAQLISHTAVVAGRHVARHSGVSLGVLRRDAHLGQVLAHDVVGARVRGGRRGVEARNAPARPHGCATASRRARVGSVRRCRTRQLALELLHRRERLLHLCGQRLGLQAGRPAAQLRDALIECVLGVERRVRDIPVALQCHPAAPARREERDGGQAHERERCDRRGRAERAAPPPALRLRPPGPG